VLTPLVREQIDSRAESRHIAYEEAEHTMLIEKQPSERFTTIEQIAGLGVFLCSDVAANITGASLTIDGAWTAQ
jgi:3-hydroxybutyrate dehydrogenase